MDVTIRKAIPEDAFSLARVHVDSWHSAYAGIVPETFLQAFTYEKREAAFRKNIADRAEETYLAENDGEVLGFLTVGASRDQDVDHAVTGEIWGIYIAPKAWRNGIGRQLAKFAEALLTSRDREVVVLWVLSENQQARRFYEALGYTADGAIKEVNLGKPLCCVRYRKCIRSLICHRKGDEA